MELAHYSGPVFSTRCNEWDIYIPKSETCKEAFWESIQLKYQTWNSQFYFRLNLEDYYNLMMKVKSLREQIQMATCLALNGLREKGLLFLQKHINKAVEIAIKENDTEQIKLYAHFHLLDEEKGFRIRHGKYLSEKYQNSAGEYLKNWI